MKILVPEDFQPSTMCSLFESRLQKVSPSRKNSDRVKGLIEDWISGTSSGSNKILENPSIVAMCLNPPDHDPKNKRHHKRISKLTNTATKVLELGVCMCQKEAYNNFYVFVVGPGHKQKKHGLPADTIISIFAATYL
ncbi:hypothetical protein YC2023_107395 [Brassica napus]